MVSGETFGNFLQKEIFEPLGMKDTGFVVPRERGTVWQPAISGATRRADSSPIRIITWDWKATAKMWYTNPAERDWCPPWMITQNLPA